MASVIVLQLFDTNGRPMLVGKSQVPDHSDWLELTALQKRDPNRAQLSDLTIIVSYGSLLGVDRTLRQAALEGRYFKRGVLKAFLVNGLQYIWYWQGELTDVTTVSFSQGDPSSSNVTFSVGMLTVSYTKPDGADDASDLPSPSRDFPTPQG